MTEIFSLCQGPHLKENDVNDVKLKLMKLLKGYSSSLAPFCPRNLINKVLAEVSEVLYKLLVYAAKNRIPIVRKWILNFELREKKLDGPIS